MLAAPMSVDASRKAGTPYDLEGFDDEAACTNKVLGYLPLDARQAISALFRDRFDNERSDELEAWMQRYETRGERGRDGGWKLAMALECFGMSLFGPQELPKTIERLERRLARRPDSRYVRLFRDGVERHPAYLPLCARMQQRLLPKWGGSMQALDEFIVHTVTATRATEGEALYAGNACRAHDARACGNARARLTDDVLMPDLWPTSTNPEVCDRRYTRPA